MVCAKKGNTKENCLITAYISVNVNLSHGKKDISATRKDPYFMHIHNKYAKFD